MLWQAWYKPGMKEDKAVAAVTSAVLFGADLFSCPPTRTKLAHDANAPGCCWHTGNAQVDDDDDDDD